MFPQIKTILVGVDFSRPSEHALTYAQGLGRTLGASVHLLHVVPDPIMASAWSEAYAYDLALLGDRQRAEAEQQISADAQTITGVKVTTEVVIGNPAKVIVEVAAERDAGLIVLGTHGRSGFSHLFMGSVAERVVRTAPCPVLTVRQPVAETNARHTPDLRSVRA